MYVYLDLFYFKYYSTQALCRSTQSSSRRRRSCSCCMQLPLHISLYSVYKVTQVWSREWKLQHIAYYFDGCMYSTLCIKERMYKNVYIFYCRCGFFFILEYYFILYIVIHSSWSRLECQKYYNACVSIYILDIFECII